MAVPEADNPAAAGRNGCFVASSERWRTARTATFTSGTQILPPGNVRGQAEAAVRMQSARSKLWRC
jgi:hypothetical protein